MEHAQALVRTIARVFYETRSILVIDALCTHSTLWVDDLATVLSMNTKDLRKLCGQLREDKMISIHQRSETKPGQTRAQSKEYYYIDYHLAIDAIKLRVVRLQQKVQDTYAPSQELKDFSCPRCQGQFTEMEALSKAWTTKNTMDFPCPRCDAPLNRTETSAADRAGSVRSGLLLKQLDSLVGENGLLRRIDNSDIPDNTFEAALTRHRPIERFDGSVEIKWEVVKPEHQNSTVHGVKVDAPEVKVSFTTQQETERVEAEKKRLRLEQHQKNILPSWHTQSTVTGQKTTLGDEEEARIKEIGATLNPQNRISATDTKPAADTDQYIAAYYQLLADQDKKVGEGSEGTDDDDDDDDDEGSFEDVIAVATPAGSTSGMKRRLDDSDPGSGLNTAVGTPAFVDSPSKRLKIEDGAAEEEEEVEDDDDEFENAL